METPNSPRLLYLAPVVFLAHVAEEAPGLIAWLNRHAEPDLTPSDFLAINAGGLLVTVVVAILSVRSPNYLLSLGLIAWLSFAMLTNGFLHLTASLLLREYVPGTVTAGIFYLPYFFAATVTICRNLNVRLGAAIVAATIGAVPMLVQGVGIFAFGRRILW